LQSLISIAEGQTEHSMPSSATVVNLKKIADGSITYGSKPSKIEGAMLHVCEDRCGEQRDQVHKKQEGDLSGG
jgi:hypothetical protein